MNRKTAKAHTSHAKDPLVRAYFILKDKKPAIVFLKQQRTYSQAKILLPKLGTKLMNQDLRLAVCGVTKPTTWDEVMQHPFLPRSKDWVQEFGWLAHGFLVESQLLNNFLRLRKQFGQAYLLGDYSTAKVTLAEIESSFGPSLWLAERQLMLLQTSEGFNAQKQWLSETQTKIKDALVGYLITTCSTRLEPNFLPSDHLVSAQNAVEQFKKGGSPEWGSWIELHISPWSFEWLNHKHDLLWCCGTKTLIDRYDRVTKILSCTDLKCIGQAEASILISILRDLVPAIQDRQLQHVLNALHSDNKSIDDLTSKYLSALDLIAEGRYKESAKIAEELTLQDPSCFEFLWLLAKACAFSQDPVQLHIPEHSVVFQVITNLREIVANRLPIDLPALQLNLIALKLGDNHLGLSLRQFYKYEESRDCDPAAISQLNIQSKIDVCSLLDGQESVLSARGAGDGLIQHNKHVSVQLELYSTGHLETALPSDKISTVFITIAQAKRFAAEGRHSDTLTALLPLTSELDVAKSNEAWAFGGVIAQLQFEAYLALNQPENAASEVIAQYTRNPNNLRHVRYERLVQGCLDGRWPQLQKLPCWPILILFNQGSEQDIYEAVDDLLIEHNCISPLAFTDGTIACPDDELRIILRDVLVPKVIARGALWNTTAQDRREMRKSFLQKLYSISSADQSMVVEELSQIEQAQLLETAYRDIEGPKFNLNYSSLNRDLAKILGGAHNRFCEFLNYEQKGGMLANEEDLLNSVRGGTEIQPNTKRRLEFSSILLSQIAGAAFVHYLTDTNAGINSFLGTRIRHGSLVNQLTRVLNTHGLLALKDAANQHICNSSVMNLLQEADDESRAAVIDAHFQFTQTINRMVNELITVVLRIRVPESVMSIIERNGQKATELRTDTGILNFTKLFNEDTISELHGTAAASITSLLAATEAIFVKQANAAFSAAREYIERDVAARILTALQQLENEIQDALPEGLHRASLKANVLAAKGSYAEDLKIISTWFSAAKSTEQGLGTFRDIMLLAARVVNFASNGKLGSVSFGAFANEKPQTEVGRLMYEVAAILLRNVVQHSRVDESQKVCIEHSFDGDRRILILRNLVCDETECNHLIDRANEAIARPFDDWALASAPGGTGFVRIRKLLRQAGFQNVHFNVRALTGPCRFETQLDYSP